MNFNKIANISLSLLLLSFSQNLLAQEVNNTEDADLSFLPPSVEDAEATPKNSATANKQIDLNAITDKNYQFTLDNVFQVTDKKSPRDLIFNIPELDRNNSDWSNLTRIGMRGDTELRPDLSLKTNLLINAYTRENDSFSASRDLRIDVKEAYLSWQQSPTNFIDIGRINIKSGLATGFNPTDYFKVGTLLDRNTEDVSQLRDARIGSLALRGQKLWNGGSLSMVVSPKISNKTDHWSTNKDIYGLNLHRSNDRSRVMLKLNQKITEDFSPEVIYYNESGKHNLGLNISKSFNDQWLGYAEWNIGKRRSLVDQALHEPRNHKPLHPFIRKQFSNDQGESYQQQFAVGLSHTSSLNIVSTIEYHYNEAGLSKSQSKNWFDLAETHSNPAVLGQLLSVRSLARKRNEPLGQHSLFMRSKWNDAFIDKLDLTGLLVADLNDQSTLFQLEAEYELNPKSSLSLTLAKFQGNRKSNYGSLDNDMTASLKFEYSF